jgi:hypothetical protein
MQEFHDRTPSDGALSDGPDPHVVVFPNTKAAFNIGRPSSVRALEAALAGSESFPPQHDATVEDRHRNRYTRLVHLPTFHIRCVSRMN